MLEKRKSEKSSPNGVSAEERSSNRSIAAREETVLAYWKEHQIFEKSLKKNEGKEPYVFYDGPPFATGLPHYGHILAGTIKDVIPRYQTMRGRYVRREWGWDCHGLPIENLIEKELGIEHKREIEEYGIERFNEKARASVLAFDKEWKEIVPRMGRWVDMERAYKTMDASYTESIWWAFKTLYDKRLIYEGYKSMHICPRCETTLAISEVGMNYKDVKDIAVVVKFKLKAGQKIRGKEIGNATYLLAWTTTPWTLPGNVALAVGKNIPYVAIAHGSETLILSKQSWEQKWKSKDFDVLENFVDDLSGDDLVGLAYEPIFSDFAMDEKLPHHENGWKVYVADFVTTTDGTGVVHVAPAFGEDDMELGKRMKLPFVQHVGMDGKVKGVTGFEGKYVKPKSDDDKTRLATDIAMLKYLEAHGAFFAKENITHSYPHCWRCDWPLLNYAASSWFVDVTKLKEKLVAENREISWIPEHVKEGRFGKWLEGARDWAISRARYWGAPLPAWKCNTCGKVDVIGSLEELRAKTRGTNRYFLMRHGEAVTNSRGVVNWKPDDPFPLTEKGREQVRKSARELKNKNIDLIITSPVFRTMETAELVRSILQLSEEAVIIDSRITEVNTGEFNGRPIDDYRMYFSSALEKFTKRPPGGETLEEMKSRVMEFFYDIDKKYQGKNILVVTHEYAVWLMEAGLRGATNAEAAWMRVEGGEDYIENAEVREFPFAPIPHNDRYELDFHRPYIDRISYPCTCTMGMMERISEVFDCWFESGSMPFAQFHYMGDETTSAGKLFTKNFPADFIAEGLDQTRGWFYTMLILSTALFDRAAYKSAIVNGLILGEDGQKMSKKLKNYPDPMEIAGKYGADALRFYMISSPVVRGEDLRFSEAAVDEIFKKVTLRLDNACAFYELYADGNEIAREAPSSANPLDKWILARFFETHAEVTHHLDTHELDRAARPIMPFIDDLSTWYIRRSRERFKSDDAEDRRAAIETTGWVLYETAKLIAPMMPFFAEDLYRRLPVEEKKESIHLEDWQTVTVVPQEILEEMAEVRRVVTAALEVRAKKGIKVRQPLALLRVNAKTLAEKKELLGIIADEVNVHEVAIDDELGIGVVLLDTTITATLKEEGDLRDLIRLVQDGRKKAGLLQCDKVNLLLTAPKELLAVAEKHDVALKKATNAVVIERQEGALSVEVVRVTTPSQTQR